MAGGLKVGSLYASLGADIAPFNKAMGDAMKQAERVAREVKRIGAETATMAGAIAAAGAAAVKMASAVDGPTKAAVDGLQKSTQLLAVQVADMLLPAVKALTAMFQQAAAVVAGLDPEVKAQIANFAVMAVQVAALAKGLSMFAGLAGNVIAVLRAIAAIGVGPILATAAAVASLIAVVVLLHRAWRKNWGGIQDATAEVLNWLRDGFGQFTGFMGKMWNFLVDGAASFVNALLNVGAALERITGKDLGVSGLREGFAGMFADLKSGSFVTEFFKFGTTLGAKLVEGFADEVQHIKKELGLDQLFKGGTPIALGRGIDGPVSKTVGSSSFEAHLEASRATAQVGSMDTSSMGTMSWFGGMQAAAADAAGSMEAIAADFSSAEGAAVESEMAARQATQAALEAAREQADTAAKWAAVGKIALSGFTRALGEVGNLINSAIEGAQAGGPVGAVVAVIMEVLQKTASAMEFLGTAMEFVQRIAAMMEPLVKPIFDAMTNVLGIVAEIVEPIFAALVPLFESIGGFVKQLSPILYAVGDILSGLAPILEVIGNVVGVIFQALKPIIDLISGILKVVATVILGVIIALNEIAGAFGDEKAKAESARLKGIVDKMWAPSANEMAIANGEAAGATLRNAEAQDEAAKSAKKVSESLSNVPSGYRIANARYQADLGITAGNGYMGGGAAAGGTVNNFYGDIVTDENSLEALAAAAADSKKEAARERGQRTGNPTRPPRGRGGID